MSSIMKPAWKSAVVFPVGGVNKAVVAVAPPAEIFAESAQITGSKLSSAISWTTLCPPAPVPTRTIEEADRGRPGVSVLEIFIIQACFSGL